MRGWFAAAAVLAGCSFQGPGARVTSDASVTGDAPPGCVPTCSGDDLLTCPDLTPVTCPIGCDEAAGICSPIAPSNNADDHGIDTGEVSDWIVDADIVIDTDDGSVTGGIERPAGTGVANGIGYQVVAGSAVLVVASLTVASDADVEVVGSLPLIIRSTGDVVIEGRIDVSAGLQACALLEQQSCPGPGGGGGGDTDQPAGGCADGGDGEQGNGGTSESGGGGGGGTVDGARGGNGSGSSGGAGGVPDSAACVAAAIVPLTGGSGGGRGGAEGNTDHAGGGGGGGAIQISSDTSIRITGTGRTAGILAAGEGGAGGATEDGGGGGGSGGSILLEAPLIHLEDATLAANGGGGGGGDDGEDGEAGRFDDQRANGGNGGGGSDGGDGGTASDPQNGDNSNVDTGGGGGAAGRIRLNQLELTTAGSVVRSPPETTGVLQPAL